MRVEQVRKIPCAFSGFPYLFSHPIQSRFYSLNILYHGPRTKSNIKIWHIVWQNEKPERVVNHVKLFSLFCPSGREPESQRFKLEKETG